jgi:hypothetical protein
MCDRSDRRLWVAASFWHRHGHVFVETFARLPVVVLIHDYLLSQGSPFNLLSVSQFQSSPRNSVNFSTPQPSLFASAPSGHAFLPLTLEDGLYTPSDDRYRSLPRFDLTPTTLPTTTVSALSALADDSGDSRLLHPGGPSLPHDLVLGPLGTWSCKMLAGATARNRILAFPSTSISDFDAVRQFCDEFLSPLAAPPARRLYDPTNPLHMADLSASFMGIGDERLRRTIELNRGLLPATARVPVHPFPQGRLAKTRCTTFTGHRFARWSSRTLSRLAITGFVMARPMLTIVRDGAT